MGKAVLEIDVDIDGAIEVKGFNGTATMVKFHGRCNSEIFKGEVLPGGCDTQKEIGGNARTLSARYVLEGHDSVGTFCHLFIENNATLESGKGIRTKPIILTDSNELKWLETADLYGTVTGREGGVKITFYNNHDDIAVQKK